MKTVRFQLMNGFCVFKEDKIVPFTPASSEFLALIAVAAGEKITAKNTWEILKKPQGLPYNSNYYTVHAGELKEELEQFDISNIVSWGLHPVRFVRINIPEVECDYYDLLSLKVNPQKKSFLPNYPWAGKLFFNNWFELHEGWKKHLVIMNNKIKNI